MDTEKLNPIESSYSNRYFDDMTDKYLLLIPGEEIIFKIRVSSMTTVRMTFEPVKIDVALNENII